MKKNIEYIEAPNYNDPRDHTCTVFLGGGITNCKDWQKDLVSRLQVSDEKMRLYNPRRENFDLANPKESEIQIDWEHHYLNMCDILVFYFSEETLCPITLFELGGALERNLHIEPYYGCRRQKILVYCDPEYKRKFDVNYQIGLVRKLEATMYNYGEFVYSYETYGEFVEGLMNQIRIHNEKYRKMI